LSGKGPIGYCGLFCNACSIRQGKIKHAVENLHKVIKAYGFDKVMPDLAKWEPSMQHYGEFDNVMEGLVKLFGECPGCISGGEDPSCAIRQCCQPRDYASCAECREMESCDKVQRSPAVKKRLREIKAVDVARWAKEMQQKVDTGYCYLDEKT